MTLSVALNGETVSDDPDSDLIHGWAGRDWFFAELGEISDFDESEDVRN